MELVLSQNVDLLRISMQPDFHKIKRCFLSNTGQENQRFPIVTERSETTPDAPSRPAPFWATLPHVRHLFGRPSLTSGTFLGDAPSLPAPFWATLSHVRRRSDEPSPTAWERVRRYWTGPE